MSRKRITTTTKGNTKIKTTNGIATTTDAFYVRDLQEFTPLPNGFNASLAEHVYQLISEHQTLWDQGVWRRFFEAEVGDDYVYDLVHGERGTTLTALQQELSVMAAFKQDQVAPTCGTAMCFAGWVAELSGADWVIDAKILKKFGKDREKAYDISSRSDMLLIRNTEGTTQSVRMWDEYTAEWLVEALAKRGFTPATHHIGTITEYAQAALGISDNGNEDVELFREGNKLDNIREILDGLTAEGPRFSLGYDDDGDDDDY